MLKYPWLHEPYSPQNNVDAVSIGIGANCSMLESQHRDPEEDIEDEFA